MKMKRVPHGSEFLILRRQFQDVGELYNPVLDRVTVQAKYPSIESEYFFDIKFRKQSHILPEKSYFILSHYSTKVVLTITVVNRKVVQLQFVQMRLLTMIRVQKD